MKMKVMKLIKQVDYKKQSFQNFVLRIEIQNFSKTQKFFLSSWFPMLAESFEM